MGGLAPATYALVQDRSKDTVHTKYWQATDTRVHVPGCLVVKLDLFAGHEVKDSPQGVRVSLELGAGKLLKHRPRGAPGSSFPGAAAVAGLGSQRCWRGRRRARRSHRRASHRCVAWSRRRLQSLAPGVRGWGRRASQGNRGLFFPTHLVPSPSPRADLGPASARATGLSGRLCQAAGSGLWLATAWRDGASWGRARRRLSRLLLSGQLVETSGRGRHGGSQLRRNTTVESLEVRQSCESAEPR